LPLRGLDEAASRSAVLLIIRHSCPETARSTRQRSPPRDPLTAHLDGPARQNPPV